MNIKVFSIMLLCSLFLACSRGVKLDSLKQRGGIYYYLKSGEPFSGRVLMEQKKISGDTYLAAYYTFRGGMPSGKWESFGYNKEIIQKGFFQPVKEMEDFIKEIPSLLRININEYSEGDLNFYDIYLIVPTLDSSAKTIQKDVIIKKLIKKRIITPDEKKEINSCDFYTGEF